ncbi:T9SS type A sorting domain-containing protein [Aureispira anguillae]|uniref:PKD domain-containing protein n=1 Tax=Aureispira anguillae TaxID=2864201 RepID=A0A916DQV0_9BACT|nr:PKD domain-containing protein [Aureispira anguillae]BDS09836.1 PKD domain-containing protein [Aureispira anguillae]
MKVFNYLTLAMIFLFGVNASLQAQCTASFTHTNTGNTYNFTSSVSGGLFNPVYIWTIDDYSNYTNHTLYGANPSFTFGGTPAIGYHYVCLTVLDSITGCQTTYCDSIYVNNGGNPCAGFSGSFTYTNSGSTFNFTSAVTGGAAIFYNWNFHGLGTSNAPNPSFTYPGQGWYAVDMTVIDTISGCQHTQHDSVYVSGGNSNPCAGHSVSYTSSVSGNNVTLTGQSTGYHPITSTMYYVDGNTNAYLGSGANLTLTLPNGTHYICFYAAGTVFDSLTNTYDSCGSVYCDTIVVNGNNNPCANTFVSFGDSTGAGNNTHFYSFVGGFQAGAYYLWDFGNGTYSSAMNPTVQLSNGWHYVCLTVDDSSCVETYCDSIYVQNSGNPCNTSVWFVDSIGAGNNTHFYSFVSGFQASTYFSWDFGNGTYSNAMNPTVQLSNGWHYVCLTVGDSNCVETYCDSIYVQNNGNPCAGFAGTFNYTTSGTTVNFTSTITGGTPSYGYYWNFGDGNFGFGANPSHTYAVGTSYGVTLTISDTTGCSYTYYDTVTVGNGGNPCANTFVSFGDSTGAGNNVHFYSFVGGFQAGAYYTWDFGNGTYSNAMNPTVQLSNGWHYVCLTVDDSSCVETYCDSIYVQNNGGGCTQNEVTLTINLDNYAGETSWEVTDASGAVVGSFSYPPFMSASTMTHTLCLPNGCYNFTIYDSYGDGICCQYGQGDYALVDNSTGATLAAGGAFAYAETTNFCVGGASNPCGAFANSYFTYTVDSTGTVSFAPQIVGNQYPLNFNWDFGNGNTSTASHPTFTFATNGYHVVCLTADSAGCTFTYCDTIMITTNNNGNPAGPCVNLTADININQDSTNPFLLWMQPVVSGAAANAQFTFVWDFGDNTGGFSGSPTHIYNSYGSYVVCLMAVDNVNGCVVTFCDTITIDSSGNFSRNFTKPGFTVNTLPPVINFYTAVEQVEQTDVAINLFPNPARETVNLAINTTEAINGTVAILDVTGKIAYHQVLDLDAGEQQVTLPVSELPAGIYLVKLTSETTQKTMKFIKE